MTLHYEPDPRAVQLAEKVLSMKISVDGLLDAINDEKEKYRRRMQVVVDDAENTILEYSQDDRMTNEKLRRAQGFRKALSDPEGLLGEIYGWNERALESMRGIIDGRVLSALHVKVLLQDPKTREDRAGALRKMIDIAE